MPSSIYDTFFESSSSVEEALGSANKYVMDRADVDHKNINEILSRVKNIQGLDKPNIIPTIHHRGSNDNRISSSKSAIEYQSITQQLIREFDDFDENEEKRHSELLKYFKKVFGDEKLSGVGGLPSSGSGIVGGLTAAATKAAPAAAAGAGVGAMAVTAASAATKTLPWLSVLSLSGDSVVTDEQKESERQYALRHPEYVESHQGRGQINKWVSDAWDWTKRKFTGEKSKDSREKFLKSQMMRESGGKNIKSKNTSARGPYQITDETYRDIVKKYKSEFISAGLDPNDRDNPEVNAFAARLLNEDNAQILKKTMKTDPTYGDVDASYFLGVTDYNLLMRTDPNVQVSDVFKNRSDRRNPVLQNPDFFTKGMTVQQALDKSRSRLKNVNKSQSWYEKEKEVKGSVDNIVPSTGPMVINPNPHDGSVEHILPPADFTDKKSDDKRSEAPPVRQVSQIDSLGRSAGSVPFFLVDPGMLVTLGGMA